MKQFIGAAFVAACTFGLALPATGQERPVTGSALTLDRAVALARADQPRLLAYQSEALASEQAAQVARSLPDLSVSAGIQNFPIRGDKAFSPIDDEMTMYTIGVMREQVRRSKREAEANRILGEALVSRGQASAEERNIRREVMIAWINAVEARAKQRLIERMIADLRTGRKVMEAGVPTGSTSPALVLQADAEIALEGAGLADAKRAESRARAELARWIGDPGYGPLPDVLPTIEVPLTRLLQVDAHPQVQVALAQQGVAQRTIEAAREGRKRDISWSVMLGIRPRYGEMVSGSVSIPLQTNQRNRQDRTIAEAQLRGAAAGLRAEDARRALDSEYRVALADHEGAAAELDRLNREAVPALESAFKLAEARYQGGGGTLEQPFAIVRRYIETGIRSVETQGKRARAAAQILYVLREAHQ